MSEAAREVILSRIRRGLGDVPAEAETLPPWRFRNESEADRATRLAEFSQRVQDYKVRVERAPRAEARAILAGILSGRGIVRLAVPDDLPPDLIPEGFDLAIDSGLDIAAIAGQDGVLTLCACAIAETGTIVLDHGPGQGRRILSLLPDYHLCVVPAETILGLVPEAVARMAPSVKSGRPLTFISGPSATSDIELNRVEGVHGPRTLDVLIIED